LETTIMARRHLAPSHFVFAAASIAAVVALSTPSAHAAGTVYRCTVNGRVTFSDEPCGAQPRGAIVDDARTPAQRKEAEEVARRDAALARQMRRDRLENERIARTNSRRGPSGIRPTAQPSVEYSNTGGKVTKTVKPGAKRRTDIDESMPIYIDVPKSKEQPASVRR
jgi:hypothetical protein